MTLEQFRLLEAAVRAYGHGDAIERSERLAAPANADDFASQAIYVICNSGMRVTVARPIFERCMVALQAGKSSRTVFGHPGKAAAIDAVWRARQALFHSFLAADDKLAFCLTLPFVGPVTQHHLAKNLGVNTVKPDVHLARLADAEGVTAWELCARLAAQTRYREATIDTILWRACADGILDSRVFGESGFLVAFHVPS